LRGWRTSGTFQRKSHNNHRHGDGYSLRLRLHSAAARAVGVKYLAQVFLGLVFGSGLAVGFGGKYSLRSSNGFASHSGAQVVGQFGVNSAQLQLIRCSSS